MEGSWQGLSFGGGALTSSVELGVRYDGGDAERGFGADVGAGLAWSDPDRGIKAEFKGRGLLTHEDSDFRERGFSGSLAWDPTPGSDRGPSLTLTQSVGGMDALLGHDTMAGLAANDNAELTRRLEAEARLRGPGARRPVYSLQLRHQPVADCQRYDSLREAGHGAS